MDVEIRLQFAKMILYVKMIIIFFFQLNSDNTQSDANSKEFWVNMPNLMTHLKKVSEQKPQATYYNVDMLKYQVRIFTLQMYILTYLALNKSK